MARRLTPALRVAGLLVGAALAVLLVRRVGVGALRTTLSRVGPEFLWMVAAYAAATAVTALPWGMLMPGSARPSWMAVIASRFAASGLNAILPFFGVGEAGRLLWMPKTAWPQGTASIVADRLLFLAAEALLILGAVVIAVRLSALPPMLDLVGVLIAVIIIAVSIAIGAIAARGHLARRGAVLLRRLGVHGKARATSRVAGGDEAGNLPLWDTALRDLLSGPRQRLLAGLAVHLVGRLLFALEVYAALRVLALPAGWRETIILSAVPIALSVVGSFIPSQLGIQEACQALVAGALGIGPAAGLAVVLLQRARQLLFIALSGLLMAFAPFGRHVSGDSD
jgi:uncharacterized membrane protein YbhN (UPF0104 family)